MPLPRTARCAAAGLVAVLATASQGVAAPGTSYKIRSVTGVETLTLSGPTSIAGAPATLAIKMVVRWKAGPAGSYGIATLTPNPPAGQKRLCASNTCPTYGPMVGTATTTGTVTPTGGGTPIACGGTKGLGAVFGKGSSSLAQTLEIYKQGARRVVAIPHSQYSFIMQGVVPNPSCRAFLDESTLGAGLTVPFPVSKLGAATLALAARKTLPVRVPAGQPAEGIKGAVRVEVVANLTRV